MYDIEGCNPKKELLENLLLILGLADLKIYD